MLMLYVPVNNFKSTLDIFLSSWIELVLNKGQSIVLKDTAMSPVNREPSLLDNELSTKISYAALFVVSLFFSVLDVNRLVELLLLTFFRICK